MTRDELARVGLRVKDLEWHQLGPMPVWKSDWGDEIRLHTTSPGYFYGGRTWASLDAAREAAQEGHVERILAALTPAPVAQDVAGLIEPVAWRVRVKSDDTEEWSLLPAGGGADYTDRKGYECEPLYSAAAPRALTADAGAQPQDGNRPLPIDRETLGRMVREAWVRWAETQPTPKPSWLVPYDELAEPDKEADRQIGEAISRWTLIHDAARNSLTADAGAQGGTAARVAMGNLHPDYAPPADPVREISPDATLLAAEMQRRAVERAKADAEMCMESAAKAEAEGHDSAADQDRQAAHVARGIAAAIAALPLPTSALAAAMQVPEVRAMQQEAYIEGIKSAADTIRSMSATAGVINERTRDLFLDVLDEVRLRALAALPREKEGDA